MPSRMAAMSNGCPRVVFTPISMLSKSMKTAIFKRASVKAVLTEQCAVVRGASASGRTAAPTVGVDASRLALEGVAGGSRPSLHPEHKNSRSGGGQQVGGGGLWPGIRNSCPRRNRTMLNHTLAVLAAVALAAPPAFAQSAKGKSETKVEVK